MTRFLDDVLRSLGMTGFIVVVLLTTAHASVVSPSTNVIDLGGNRGSIEVVRCHFDERRIVVRQGGGLHVLHEGDELSTTGLRVMTLTPEAATMVIRQSDPPRSLRIIRISTTESGAIVLRELATDPAALTAGSNSGATSAPMSSTARAAPPAAPSGAN